MLHSGAEQFHKMGNIEYPFVQILPSDLNLSPKDFVTSVLYRRRILLALLIELLHFSSELGVRLHHLFHLGTH
jgi:hypothetical protein